MGNEEIKAELETLKKSLEGSLDAKAKEQVAEQLKAIEAKAEGKYAEDIKAIKDALGKEFTKSVQDLQKDVDNLKKENEQKFKDFQVTLDEKDKEIEQKMTELNRIKLAAVENEKKGLTFDVALNNAMNENADELKSLSGDKNARVKLHLKEVGTMGISSIQNIELANAQLRPGIMNLPNRRLHMRDIMNTGRMTTSDFHYLRELSTGEGDVNNWAENSGVKPALDLDYIEKVAPSQYIAGVLDISRKSLEDVSALRSSLSARLLEKYLIKEDQQILSGNGISPQIEGILQVAEAYDGTKTRLIERVVDAIGQLEENEFYADGVILKPRDWSDILLTMGNTEEFTLPGLGIITMQNGIMYINGTPVYKMNGMPASPRQFLVGDWMLGAQLLIREDPTVEFSYENADNFKQNKVTVRVEGRIALPIYFDDAFVKGNVPPITT